MLALGNARVNSILEHTTGSSSKPEPHTPRYELRPVYSNTTELKGKVGFKINMWARSLLQQTSLAPTNLER